MSDYLAPLAEPQVAAWYRRLADRIGREKIDGQEPMASIFLRHWLDNRDPASTFRFQAPGYLRQSSYVVTAAAYHRGVFLTEERARFTGRPPSWAGILPRLQGRPGFTRWDPTQSLEMQYQSLVEVGTGVLDILRIQRSGTPAERDLLTALRGFQLRSRVTVRGEGLSSWSCGARACPTHLRPEDRCPSGVWLCGRQQPTCPGHLRPEDRCGSGNQWRCGAQACPTHLRPADRCSSGVWLCGRRQPPCPGHLLPGDRCSNQGAGRIRITFVWWMCSVHDRYDWDYSEHFTVPNPDYRSTALDAVRPQDQTLTVYHSNAQRVERAGLAAPYDVESDEWRVVDPQIVKSAEVDPSRSI